MASKMTCEEMEATSRNLTTRELEKLHKEYRNFEKDNDSDSSSDTDDSEIDSTNEKPKITIKSVDKSSRKKDNTMLYMFKKYEQLQNECNEYKNKLYKMRMKMHTEEQKSHYKNLEFSNLLLDKERLQTEIEKRKYTSFKYYTSLTLNIILTAGLAYIYQRYEL